jgi:isocitrate dehydrogenase
LNTKYFDLGLPCRDATDDCVTSGSRAGGEKNRAIGQVRHHHAQPAARGGVRVKQMWKSPNGAIRAVLDGHGVPRADPGQDVKPVHPAQGEAHHHRPPRYGECTARRNCV